jgi:hypothetical protein
MYANLHALGSSTCKSTTIFLRVMYIPVGVSLFEDKLYDIACVIGLCCVDFVNERRC